MAPPREELAGKRFGRLVVLADAPPQTSPSGRRTRMLQCLCDCGYEHVTHATSLRHGITRSCGCFQRELDHPRTHGESRSVGGAQGSIEYTAWNRMRDRCTNPNNPSYSRYGGRGIKVCDRWSSYETFLSDMGRRPDDKQSIDRIDVNGNYAPENCRWADAVEQANHRRSSRFVVYRGEEMTVAGAVRAAGNVVKPYIAIGRLNSGWPIERAVEIAAKKGSYRYADA